VLEHVDADEELAVEPFDEGVQREIDRPAAASAREFGLRAADSCRQDLDAERADGGARRLEDVFSRGRRRLRLLDSSAAFELGEEQVEDERVEVGAAALAQHGDRVVSGEGGAVDAVAGDRVEDVRDCRDPSFERNGLADEAVRIARPVEPLVV
jgi:hypothetical protein